jgi:BirA family biotin operon repressor/biotin-[acetyl-CoA-carboxylase] ligase
VLVAHLLDYFMDYYNDFNARTYTKEYIARSMIIGQKIYVINGTQKKPATALKIDHDCRLKVEFSDGTTKWLSSGEVSIRIH